MEIILLLYKSLFKNTPSCLAMVFLRNILEVNFILCAHLEPYCSIVELMMQFLSLGNFL